MATSMPPPKHWRTSGLLGLPPATTIAERRSGVERGKGKLEGAHPQAPTSIIRSIYTLPKTGARLILGDSILHLLRLGNGGLVGGLRGVVGGGAGGERGLLGGDDGADGLVLALLRDLGGAVGVALGGDLGNLLGELSNLLGNGGGGLGLGGSLVGGVLGLLGGDLDSLLGDAAGIGGLGGSLAGIGDGVLGSLLGLLGGINGVLSGREGLLRELLALLGVAILQGILGIAEVLGSLLGGLHSLLKGLLGGLGRVGGGGGGDLGLGDVLHALGGVHGVLVCGGLRFQERARDAGIGHGDGGEESHRHEGEHQEVEDLHGCEVVSGNLR
mmetsp:Transcript_46387/g.148665  ORF Transcript_46387/g.148665 Transcript_46387/m.148665 type:complete len:328 (-) Transcript_46387:18-1001(-)